MSNKIFYKTTAVMFLCFLFFVPGCKKPRKLKNFILVSLDTTRLDRLSLYGNSRAVSPGLENLSRKGLVFDQAVTVTENTLISHASMFTGLYPAAHATTHLNGGKSLRKSYLTIAEDFLKTGKYQTAGFTAHGTWLNEKFGFNQGFQVFKSGFRSADAVLREVEEWLLKKRDPQKPFFLFIHLFDAHSDWDGRPYKAPEPFFRRWTADYSGRFENWKEMSPNGSIFLAAVNRGEIQLTPDEIMHIRDQYDEGLAFTDNRICGFINRYVDFEDTFVIITADHGEEFKDHDYMLHSSLYDQVVRVPLIIIPPGDMAGQYNVPRRIPDQVSIVDIRPTILGMAGMPAACICQGKNLDTWLTGKEDLCPSGPAPFYHLALRWQGYKLYKKNNCYHLFNLVKDPGEKVNLISQPEYKGRIRKMKSLLMNFSREDKKICEVIDSLEKNKKKIYSDQEKKKLRSLGYL